MQRKILLNQLKLSYSPTSNFDFATLRKDIDFQRSLLKSSLYIICQRPEIRFDNITNNENEKCIEFEIRQNENDSILKCKVPIFQEHIATDPLKEVLLNFGSNDPKNVIKSFPLNNIHGIKFYQENISKENFLIWFSPEKFLQNYWKGYIEAEIEGDISNFTKYKVHYIGKSTDQEIWERLTGHSTLQDILSKEYPFVFGSLPTHEISLLLFEFQENLTLQTFDTKSAIDDMIDSLMGRNLPEQKTIFLDAEKALIKAMQPKHNKIMFKNYPKSKDGLQNHNYNSLSYTFIDPITLQYENGEIRGGLNFMGGDTIFISENSEFEILIHK